MATWRAITEADLKTAMSGGELTAYRFAFKGEHEADPVAGSILGVVNLVRGYIARNPSNGLGPAGQLPESLIDPAVDLIVWKIMARSFGEVVDPSGARKDAASNARRLLEDIAKGNGPNVTTPDTEIDAGRGMLQMAYSGDGTNPEITRLDQEGAAI